MKNMTFSSNENIDYSQSTQKTFGSKKIFLLIMAALAAVSDLALLVVFAIAGHDGIAIPIVLLILDALFVTGVCLSNFRFKYAMRIWVTYLIISVAVTSILAVLDTGEEYMTYTAKYLNVFAHLALYAVTIFASIYPLFKSNTKLKAVMIASVVVAVTLVGAFTIYFSANGYFGQGNLGKSRVVGYTLDEDSDTYVVTSIKSGRGNKVIIPEEFNGKKVSGVHCSIFSDSSISLVEIQSKEQIEFVDTEILSGINMNINIGVDKAYIDIYRANFLKPQYEFDSSYLQMANCLYPINLQSDERYITFKYQERPTQDQIIPTWIGKAGDSFSLDYANVDYMSHSNKQNIEDLVWCYDNNNKRIISGDILKYLGNKIDSNLNKVAVDFDKVYRIQISNDNDDLYESSDALKTTTIGNKKYNYRFVTWDNADNLLKEFSREGFDLSWNKVIGTWSSIQFTSLSSELYSSGADTMTIQPEWTMKAPTDLQVSFDKTSYVYGDDILMQASAKEPNEDCKLQYDWVYSGSGSNSMLNDSDKYSISNANPQDGTFVVLVTSTSDKSSLQSTAQVMVDLQVGRRPLNFTWIEPENMVYDGQQKVLQHFTGEGELINGDALTNNIMESNIVNTTAGTYKASISLRVGLSQKYVINSGGTYTYTIAPRPTQVEWSSEEFVYDGNYHNASATAKDIYDNDLYLSLSNSQVNAGRHTAIASCNDVNYTLVNNTYQFVIERKSITIDWSSNQLTYTGYAQHPSVSRVNGLVGYDNINNQFIYIGYSSNINVGEDYSVEVQLPESSNYKFDSEQSTSYNIGKKALRIRAVASDKIYDGNGNDFDFEVVSGLVNIHTKSSLGTPTYGGQGATAIDVGTYSVSVSLPSNSVTDNYDITYIDANFSILQAQMALTWSDFVVGDGEIIPPTVTNNNLPSDIVMGEYVYRDVMGRIITSIPYENGTYSVEIKPKSKNYVFTNTSIRFVVSSIVTGQQKEVA